MNGIPNTSGKIPPLIAVVAITLMAGAYFVFLYATWNQFQNDRARREQRIDEILDRLPPAKAPKEELPDGA